MAGAAWVVVLVFAYLVSREPTGQLVTFALAVLVAILPTVGAVLRRRHAGTGSAA
jgi:hypothetical protein